VLIISLEDGADELRRRILAARLHHRVELPELKGWLFLSAPRAAVGKLMTTDKAGRGIRGQLANKIKKVVLARKIDLVCIDPFVKSHSVEENFNSLIDEVAQILTDLMNELNIAVDAPHHTSKGLPEPGNANRGRGASSLTNAMRLVYMLTPMSQEDATAFNINEELRREYIRVDSAKVNTTKHLGAAKWFHLVGVRLGNRTETYPNGDEVQTVEPWTPPQTWGDLTKDTLKQILTDIDAGLSDGNRYTDAPTATKRAAWKVVTKNAPYKSEPQARQMIRSWVKNGVLVSREYDDPVEYKSVQGLWVDHSKRPS
jgi:AAA domain